MNGRSGANMLCWLIHMSVSLIANNCIRITCACAVFTDRNLSCRELLLGASPNAKDPSWSRRLRNTPQSLVLLAEMWTSESDFRKDGSRRKRSEKDAAVLARMAALGQFILDELASDPMYDADSIKGLRQRIVAWRPALSPAMREHNLRTMFLEHVVSTCCILA